MKVLIIRFSSIGDIVLTTPVLRGLKIQLGAEVHFATKKQFAVIFAANPYVDKVHALEGELRPFLAALKAERFDHVIDLHHNLRTRIIKSWLGVPAVSFRKLNLEKWLMVNFKVNRLPARHIVDRYMDTIDHLGVTDDGNGLDWFIPATDEVQSNDLPESHRHGYVAYAIGGQHYTKKLPVERMIELCAKSGVPVVLLGGKEDEANGEIIRRALDAVPGSPSPVFNACGKYTLHQSASLLKQATRVFTHDTGLMHIAAALQQEVIVIWGNTIPAFGMTPYRTRFTNLENNSLSCRPCSKIGFEVCPKGHFKCMREVVIRF